MERLKVMGKKSAAVAGSCAWHALKWRGRSGRLPRVRHRGAGEREAAAWRPGRVPAVISNKWHQHDHSCFQWHSMGYMPGALFRCDKMCTDPQKMIYQMVTCWQWIIHWILDSRLYQKTQGKARKRFGWGMIFKKSNSHRVCQKGLEWWRSLKRSECLTSCRVDLVDIHTGLFHRKELLLQRGMGEEFRYSRSPFLWTTWNNMPECCAEWTSFLMTFNRSVRSNLAAHARQEKINKPSCEPMKNIKQIGFPILSSERWKRETALLQLTESALEPARNHLVCIRRTFHNHHQTKAKHFLKHLRGLVVLKQNFKIAHIHQFNSIQLNSIQFNSLYCNEFPQIYLLPNFEPGAWLTFNVCNFATQNVQTFEERLEPQWPQGHGFMSAVSLTFSLLCFARRSTLPGACSEGEHYAWL